MSAAARRSGATDLSVVAVALGKHRLHASLNICTGCDWRATPDVGSLAEQHEAHRAAALLPLIREREAAAWEEAVRAVAWLLDNGEPSAAAALAYVAQTNPYAEVRNADD